MLTQVSKNTARRRIHLRIRKRLKGCLRVPRMNVYRSLKHIYAQVIDDTHGQTLVAASTLDKELRQILQGGGSVAAAKVVGKVLGERAKAAGIARVVFDRGGYAYHGRVKALAESAREAGLQF